MPSMKWEESFESSRPRSFVKQRNCQGLLCYKAFWVKVCLEDVMNVDLRLWNGKLRPFIRS